MKSWARARERKRSFGEKGQKEKRKERKERGDENEQLVWSDEQTNLTKTKTKMKKRNGCLEVICGRGGMLCGFYMDSDGPQMTCTPFENNDPPCLSARAFPK